MKFLILSILVILTLFTTRWGIAWSNNQKKPNTTNPPALKSLAVCPHKPNCVSSIEQRPQWHIKPLTIPGTPEQAWLALKQAILALPRTKIACLQEDHIHATFRSKLLGFVDDGNFLLDSEHGVIQIRSASRLGHSDFGVNRRRLETIRENYQTILGKNQRSAAPQKQ